MEAAAFNSLEISVRLEHIYAVLEKEIIHWLRVYVAITFHRYGQQSCNTLQQMRE